MVLEVVVQISARMFCEPLSFSLPPRADRARGARRLPVIAQTLQVTVLAQAAAAQLSSLASAHPVAVLCHTNTHGYIV